MGIGELEPRSRTWSFRLGFAAIALALACLVYVVATWKPPFIIETVAITTNVVPETSNDRPVKIPSKLYIPREAAFPVSAVVLAPSSGGVEEAREVFYAKRLAKAGIAALIVDSYTARDLDNSLYDQSLLESWQVENDVLGALIHLQNDKRFKADKIAIMGVSKGGTVAMDTAHTVRKTWTGIEEETFAAHIAITPDCNWTNRSNMSTGAPIFFLLGELDDQTPYQSCLAKAKGMTEDGNPNISTKVYKGAHHAWEELGRKPEFDPEVENYSQCRVWIEDDGQMTEDKTGIVVPEEDWHSWAKENCATLGAHCCGGSSELKEEAMQDILEFLKKSGFHPAAS